MSTYTFKLPFLNMISSTLLNVSHVNSIRWMEHIKTQWWNIDNMSTTTNGCNILSRNANNITFLSKPFKIALDAMPNLQCVVVFNVRKRSYLFSLRDSMWNFVWMTLLKFAYASPSWQCLDHVGHIQYFVFMQVILRLFYYYESGYQNVLT